MSSLEILIQWYKLVENIMWILFTIFFILTFNKRVKDLWMELVGLDIDKCSRAIFREIVGEDKDITFSKVLVSIALAICMVVALNFLFFFTYWLLTVRVIYRLIKKFVN